MNGRDDEHGPRFVRSFWWWALYQELGRYGIAQARDFAENRLLLLHSQHRVPTIGHRRLGSLGPRVCWMRSDIVRERGATRKGASSLVVPQPEQVRTDVAGSLSLIVQRDNPRTGGSRAPNP